MTLAPDFWQSKTTWTALGGVVSTVAAKLMAPDWLPVVASLFAFLEICFVRDNQARTAALLTEATHRARETQERLARQQQQQHPSTHP